jgi:hypothetical protein
MLIAPHAARSSEIAVAVTERLRAERAKSPLLSP